MTTGITLLCADDYGLDHGVCDAVIRLVDANRLSMTSALVNMPAWPERAAELVARANRVAIGLHVNLTEGRPLGPMPSLAPDGTLPGIGALVGRALTRRLDRTEIAAEIVRQLERFEAVAGYPPDYIDGHHHSHALPVVRDALFDVLASRAFDRPPLLRDPADRLAAIFLRRTAAPKAAFVHLLATGFGRRARALGFPVNEGFSGFSDFGGALYAHEFERFLVRRGPRHMIMCHPRVDAPDRSDASRGQEEYAYLAGRDGLDGLIWQPRRHEIAEPAFAAL